MKQINLILLAVALGMAACNQNSKHAENAADSAGITENNDALEKHCFYATSNQDSAEMRLNHLNGKITGHLNFNFAEKDDAIGTLKGEFKGDTLFVDFTFTSEGRPGRNPLVFLKDGDNLVQGHGEIETYLGKTYFKDNKALKFENGFTFEPGDCK